MPYAPRDISGVLRFVGIVLALVGFVWLFFNWSVGLPLLSVGGAFILFGSGRRQ